MTAAPVDPLLVTWFSLSLLHLCLTSLTTRDSCPCRHVRRGSNRHRDMDTDGLGSLLCCHSLSRRMESPISGSDLCLGRSSLPKPHFWLDLSSTRPVPSVLVQASKPFTPSLLLAAPSTDQPAGLSSTYLPGGSGCSGGTMYACPLAYREMRGTRRHYMYSLYLSQYFVPPVHYPVSP